MAISFDKALGIHEKALNFRAQRAEVLANNIANADTPHYKARDLEFSSVLASQTSKNGTFNLNRTSARHIEGEAAALPVARGSLSTIEHCGASLRGLQSVAPIWSTIVSTLGGTANIGGEGVSFSAESLQYRTPHHPSIDGNTVDAQVEQAAYTKNAVDFQASFTFLNSKFKGLMSAIKGE